MNELRVKTNQIEMQIREYEHGGEAIIFLHFSGANLMMWQRVVPTFQDRFRLILVDLRGHGKSDKPDGGYHMDEMARDVEGIMQQLNLESAHIVGSSLGAEVGLSLAANYPERVRSLVCDGALSSEFGPYGTWEGSEAEFEEHVASQLERIRDAPELFFPSIEAFVADRRQLFEKYDWWNEWHETAVRYDAYKLAEGKYRKSFGKKANENYMSHYFYYRFEEYYPKVTCPVLMLAEKEADDAREIAAMEGLCQLAGRGEITKISGWAHPYCWFLQPEEASEAIINFLGRVASARV